MGVRATLVEIGAMDTLWATSGMQFSVPLPGYDELRQRLFGTSAVPWPSEPGATGGGSSAEAIADGILAHVNAEEGPLRLVLDQRQQDYARQPGFHAES